MRLFKNKTQSEVEITCGSRTQAIPGEDEFDLATVFTIPELQACDGLVELLGQGTDKYQLNNGAADLSVTAAIDLIRGFQPTEVKITTGRESVGVPLLASVKPSRPKLTFITPNWCDKTTWYGDAARVEDEVATDSGDHTTYNLAHQNVIDSYHGKITFEDYLKDSQGRSYRVVVKVNGSIKTERDPHVGSGGDYEINYAQGKVVFFQALAGNETVTVTYYYAQKSTYVIKPDAGKRLYVGTVEVQFSDDIEMNDTFVFQAYGLVDVFAPQLMPGIPSGTKIPLGDPLVYKTFNDLLNDSNGAYPGYPAFGGGNWRALKKQAFIFVWDYTVGMTCLEAAYGMEIHIDLQHDVPCGGTYGTATMYCTSEDEGL